MKTFISALVFTALFLSVGIVKAGDLNCQRNQEGMQCLENR